MRIKSIGHAEWEILNEMISNIAIDGLKQEMCPDEHASKRFDTAASNMASMLNKMLSTRRKHLPAEHTHYKGD